MKKTTVFILALLLLMVFTAVPVLEACADYGYNSPIVNTDVNTVNGNSGYNDPGNGNQNPDEQDEICPPQEHNMTAWAPVQGPDYRTWLDPVYGAVSFEIFQCEQHCTKCNTGNMAECSAGTGSLCVEDGTCTRCGRVFTQHGSANGKVQYDDDSHWLTCDCGKEIISNKTAHSFDKLESDSESHWYVCACGKTTAKEKHKGGTATCTSKAVCSVCGKEYGSTDPNAHDLVHTDAKAATCTEDGWNAYDSCKREGCNYSSKVIIPAGHTEVTDAAVTATCTETGLTAGSHCSVCNAVLTAQETVPAKGHTEVTDAAVAATCTETGLTAGSHCSVCNAVLVAQETVPAAGHTEEILPAVEPTKESTGLTEGKKCSVCGAILAEQKVIPKIEPVPVGAEGWIDQGGTWYYGDADKNAVTGFAEIGGSLYFFDKDGKMVTGWFFESGKWYYADHSGALYNSGWTKIKASWYYFNADGSMAVGWISYGGSWYLMSPEGPMSTGWVMDKGKWYFFSDSGVMLTGWQHSGDLWYLLKNDGEMAVGWTLDNGIWYYFDDSGVMKTGWFEDKEAEKKLNGNQKRAIWYWFDENGAMATDWKLIDGRWEYFSPSGVWQYSWEGN